MAQIVSSAPLSPIASSSISSSPSSLSPPSSSMLSATIVTSIQSPYRFPKAVAVFSCVSQLHLEVLFNPFPGSRQFCCASGPVGCTHCSAYLLWCSSRERGRGAFPTTRTSQSFIVTARLLQRLYDRLWFFITESLLAFTIFRDEFDIGFVLMFGFLLFVKSFHWLSSDRVEWVITSLFTATPF